MTLICQQRELLQFAKDDWVDLAQELAILALISKNQPVDREAALAILAEMVGQGWMEVGELDESSQFRAWGDTNSMTRVRQLCSNFVGYPPMGESCWLNNTAAGDDLVRLVS